MSLNELTPYRIKLELTHLGSRGLQIYIENLSV